MQVAIERTIIGLKPPRPTLLLSPLLPQFSALLLPFLFGLLTVLWCWSPDLDISPPLDFFFLLQSCKPSLSIIKNDRGERERKRLCFFALHEEIER
ncbi:hypothetical protein RchiOBHm_Chr7g0213821 [Rosa chinensis]|uniref:Uncharacterized protein n=1 Tax=Rosa chinensis TaxID=74649 RepID=A0A2P6PB33_ROSCH|nr:hypothetical protein RchiOBHm_Chr7g0213821 [Rosa chinensis]